MTDGESQRTARFDELFRACVADIAAHCRWRTRSAADAGDALSEREQLTSARLRASWLRRRESGLL